MSYKDLIKPRTMAVCKKGEYGGSPRYTPEEFEQLVDGYIEECNELQEIPTMMHFAMTIKISREQLYKFYGTDERYKNGYAQLVSCRDGILEHRALNPQENERRSPTMMIFALKQIGWTDKQDVNHTSSDGSMSPKGKTLDDFYADADD
jgi:hypothetical protein